MPALFTTTSSGPRSATAAPTAASTSAALLTSARYAFAPGICDAVSRAEPSSRSTTARAKPRLPSASAQARPMPEPAPVTSARRASLGMRTTIQVHWTLLNERPRLRSRRPRHRRRLLRPVPAPLPARPAGTFGQGGGGGARSRRHVVLEPLSRRALRLGEPLLLLLLLEAAARGMALVGALSRAAGDPALSQPRGGQVRPSPRHPLQQPRYRCALRRKPLARAHRIRRALPRALPHHRGGLPLVGQRAAHSGPGELRRPLLSHRPVAARRRGLPRQARRPDRHRLDRHPDGAGDRADCRAPDGFPAARPIQRPGAQRATRRRIPAIRARAPRRDPRSAALDAERPPVPHRRAQGLRRG